MQTGALFWGGEGVTVIIEMIDADDIEPPPAVVLPKILAACRISDMLLRMSIPRQDATMLETPRR